MNGKSKLVVPVIAIMMCAVALAGVAYAYSASITMDDNTADGNNFTLDLKNSDGTAFVVAPYALEKTFVLSNATVIDGTSNNVVISAESAGVVESGRLIITTDLTDNVKIDMAAISGKTVTLQTASGSIILTPTVTMYKDSQKTQGYTPGTNLGTGSQTVYFDISVVCTGEGLTFANTTDAASCITQVENAIGTLSFDLQFTAGKYVAPQP